MAHLDRATGWWIGDHHGETDSINPRDLWCAGCHAWTDQRGWHFHAWHHPVIQPKSA
jgi:hypothetical protein